MIHGNWIPIHKSFVKFLPTDRSYTPLEAMFSLTLDASNKKYVSVSGYAKLWSWNRKTVKKFLDDCGVEIVYKYPLSEIQNQKGQIKGQIRDRSGTDQGQIRFIIDKALYDSGDR